MTDLEINRLRRIENQVCAIAVQLALTTADLAEVFDELYYCYDADSPRAVELQRRAQAIRTRVESLRSLTPR